KLFVDGRPWPVPGAVSDRVDHRMDIPKPDMVFDIGQLAEIGAPPPSSSLCVELPIEVGDEAQEHVVNMLGRTWSVQQLKDIGSDEIAADGLSAVLRPATGHRGIIRFAFRGDANSWLGPLEFMETLPNETQIRDQLRQWER